MQVEDTLVPSPIKAGLLANQAVVSVTATCRIQLITPKTGLCCKWAEWSQQICSVGYSMPCHPNAVDHKHALRMEESHVNKGVALKVCLCKILNHIAVVIVTSVEAVMSSVRH